MKLNLAIIGDVLPLRIKEAHVKNLYQLKLERFEMLRCDGRKAGELKSNTLYICDDPDLTLPFDQSFICIGFTPQTSADHLVIDLQDAPLDSLLVVLCDIFKRFDEWEIRLANACNQTQALAEFIEVGAEVFENTCCILDANCMQLAHKHIPEKGPYLDYYADMDYQYPQQIQNTRATSSEWDVAFSQDLPFIWKSQSSRSVEGIPDTSTLTYNIKNNGIRIGTIVIDETQREFRKSDMVLLKFFGEYINHAMMRSNILPLTHTSQLDWVIGQLMDGAAYRPEWDTVLATRGWKNTDTYRCAQIYIEHTEDNQSLRSQVILFFLSSFDEAYVNQGDEPGTLVVLFNKSVSAKSQKKLSDSLTNFAESQKVDIGLSESFSGLGTLKLHMQQAAMSLYMGWKKNDARFHSFDSIALDALLIELANSPRRDAFVIEKLCSLKRYDSQNNSDLVSTLKTYLECNGNAASATNKLHVGKTTFYYRLSRIEQISGFNLDSYRTRLYLSIILEMMDTCF